MDLDTAVDADQQVVIFAERSGSLSDSDTITVEKAGNAVADAETTAHKGYFVLAGGKDGGEYTVKVNSASAGTVTMKAYVVKGADGKSIAQIYNGDNEIIKTALVGNGCTGKFTAVSSEIAFDTVVTTADGNALAGTNGVYYGAVANDGVDYYKVALRVTKGGSKLVGEKVTISVDKNGATLSKEEATTSATGKVDFKVYANKAGTYTVTVQCGNMAQEYKFAFSEGAVSQIKIDSVTDKVLPVDYKETLAMTVSVYDTAGNKIVPSTDTCNMLNDRFTAVVFKAPADSLLEDEELQFNYNTNVCDSIFISFTPDAAGEYTIKVYDRNTGTGDTAVLRAAQFGEIDHALISYAADTYPIGEKTPNGIVKVVDKDGVVTNAAMKQFSYTGDGVAAFDSANGNITFTNDKAYVGEKVTVKVVVNNNYTAETTLTIADRPSTLDFAPVRATAGEETTVALQVLDKNGQCHSDW